MRVLSGQQWAPELAEDAADAESVLFIDCAVDAPPGSIRLLPVEASESHPGLATHHLGAAELLGLARELYASLPRSAFLLIVGAGSTELGEQFSGAVQAALPEACSVLEQTVLRLLADSSARQKQAL